GELPTRLGAGNDERCEIGAAGIDRGGVAGAAGADDDDVFHVQRAQCGGRSIQVGNSPRQLREVGTFIVPPVSLDSPLLLLPLDPGAVLRREVAYLGPEALAVGLDKVEFAFAVSDQLGESGAPPAMLALPVTLLLHRRDPF